MDSRSSLRNLIRPGSLWAWIGLLGCALAIPLLRLHGYGDPMEPDCNIFATIGHELLKGRSLYTDFWDSKPPLIFLTHAAAEALVGPGPQAFYLLSVLSALLGLPAAFAAGRMLGGRWQTGLLAAFFWTVLSGDFGTTADQPRAEMFMKVFTLWTFIFFTTQRRDQLDPVKTLGIGLLVFLDTLYKPYVGLDLLFFAGTRFLTSASTWQKGLVIRQTLVSLSILVAGWVLVIGYFVWTGRGPILWDTFVLHGSYYSGSILGNLLSALEPYYLTSSRSAFLFPLLLIGLGLGFKDFHRAPALWALWTTYAWSTWVDISYTGLFYNYYYQLWIPVVCTGLAWALESIFLYLGRIWSWAFFLLICLFLIFFEGFWFLNKPSDISFLRYGDGDEYNLSMGKVIQGLLRPDECFFEWCYGSNFYWSSQRDPAARVLDEWHLFLPPPLGPELTRGVLEDLQNHKPELVVADRIFGTNSFKKISFNPDLWRNNPVYRYILMNYEPFDSEAGGRFVLYDRKGGQLEKRLRYIQPLPVIARYSPTARQPILFWTGWRPRIFF